MHDAFTLDLRSAARQAWRNPGYSLAAFAALAVGIGATVAMFTVVSGVLLRALPVENESRLVRIDEMHTRTGSPLKTSMTDFFDWKQRSKSFSAIALYRVDQGNVTGSGPPERVRILVADTNLLPLLGAKPVEGRNFSQDQSQPNGATQALISSSYWKSRYGGQDVLGRQIVIDEKPYTIAGVVPDLLMMFGEEQVWLPLPVDLNSAANTRGHHRFYAVGRLQPGVPVPQANREIRTVAATLASEYPRENRTVSARAEPLRQSIVGDYGTALVLLFGFVVVVLLIACVNVASLALARASVRRREMSIRIAVGATRLRIFRQLLTESALLSVTACAAGVLLALISVWLVEHTSVLTIPLAQNIRVDWTVACFSAGLALLIAIGCGTAPALRGASASVSEALKQSNGRNTDSRSRQLLKRWFVFLQSALATLLLLISGLLLRSFVKASGIDPGFNPRHVLTANLSLPPSRAALVESGKFGQFLRAAIDEIAATPGIEAAAMSSDLPLIGTGGGGGVIVEGQTEASTFDAPYAQTTRVSPGYFSTLQIPLLAGRDFELRDHLGTTVVAIVNQTFARTILRTGKAIGQRVAQAADPFHYAEIIGVVGDVPQLGIEKKVIPEIFFSLAQVASPWLTIVARTQDRPESYITPIRTEIQKLDPGIAVFLPRTMEQILASQRGWRSFETSIVLAFAMVAVLLAALGTYAVIAYSVAQRASEVGLRMALGASYADILRKFTLQGAVPAILGAVVGVLIGFAIAKLSASLLYGIRPDDAVSFVGAAVILICVALIASWIPARRAASLDPWRALRYE